MKPTKTQREAVHAMFDGRCAYCGNPLNAGWHADHIQACKRESRWDRKKHSFVATGEFGKPEANRLDNLFPACPQCNIDKGSLSLEGWRRKLSDACGVLERNRSVYRLAKAFGLITETGASVVFYFERVAASVAINDDVTEVGNG